MSLFTGADLADKVAELGIGEFRDDDGSRCWLSLRHDLSSEESNGNLGILLSIGEEAGCELLTVVSWETRRKASMQR